jgi:hypothetical protein
MFYFQLAYVSRRAKRLVSGAWRDGRPSHVLRMLYMTICDGNIRAHETALRTFLSAPKLLHRRQTVVQVHKAAMAEENARRARSPGSTVN